MTAIFVFLLMRALKLTVDERIVLVFTGIETRISELPNYQEKLALTSERDDWDG